MACHRLREAGVVRLRSSNGNIMSPQLLRALYLTAVSHVKSRRVDILFCCFWAWWRRDARRAWHIGDNAFCSIFGAHHPAYITTNWLRCSFWRALLPIMACRRSLFYVCFLGVTVQTCFIITQRLHGRRVARSYVAGSIGQSLRSHRKYQNGM